MPVVIIQLPDYKTSPNRRPESCPYCTSQILQRWGQAPKNLQDIHQTYAEVHRYRCSECGRTFRHYPHGVDRSIQSQRLRQMAALAWVIGLSSRDVVEIFKPLGVELSRMTVWREGRALARQLQERDAQTLLKKYTLDRIYLPGVSYRFGVVIVLDAGSGKRIVLGTLDEFNPRHVKSWLEQITQDLDFQVAVSGTDFLSPTAPLAMEREHSPA